MMTGMSLFYDIVVVVVVIDAVEWRAEKKLKHQHAIRTERRGEKKTNGGDHLCLWFNLGMSAICVRLSSK